MSNLIGLYVQRLASGGISKVQVGEPGVQVFALDPEEYRQRGIQPPIEQLPNQADYRRGPSPLIAALYSWHKDGRKLTERAEEDIKSAGWLVSDSDGNLGITAPGLQTLRENGYLV